MFYIWIVIFSVVLIIAIDTLILGIAHILPIILAVVLSTIAVIVLDIIFATLVRWVLPKSWFTRDKKGFVPNKLECKFFDKLFIKKWKDKVLELGFATNFSKNKIAEPSNNAYIERYIVEANYGISVHLACMLCGFLVILIYPSLWLMVGLPVNLINILLNFMSFAALRYNLPKLHKVYELNVRRANRNKKDTIIKD